MSTCECELEVVHEKVTKHIGNVECPESCGDVCSEAKSSSLVRVQDGSHVLPRVRVHDQIPIHTSEPDGFSKKMST